MSSPFVLLHGASHGGWCYREVARILRDHGHDVYTPTLTGHGERSHLDTSSATMGTFVADVANVLFYEDLHDVVLVGHSLGGVTIPFVARAHPDRIRRVVFLAAVVERDGERDVDRDHTEGAPLLAAGSEAIARGEVEVWKEIFLDAMLGESPVEQRAWVAARIGGPADVIRSAPGRLSEFLALGIPTGYVVATRDEALPPPVCRRFASYLPGCRVLEVDGPHDVMITHPEATAEVLLRMAAGDP